MAKVDEYLKGKKETGVENSDRMTTPEPPSDFLAPIDEDMVIFKRIIVNTS